MGQLTDKDLFPVSEAAPASTGNGWIQQLEQGIKLFQSLQNKPASQVVSSPEAKALIPADMTASLKGIIALLNQAGLGDMPVGQLLQRLSPFSPNQIAEFGAKFGNRPSE